MSKRSRPDTLQEESRHLLLHGAALFIPANSTRIREKHHGLLGTQYYAEFLSTDLKKQHLTRRRLQNSDVLGNEDPLVWFADEHGHGSLSVSDT
jgi:hypothetical protein